MRHCTASPAAQPHSGRVRTHTHTHTSLRPKQKCHAHTRTHTHTHACARTHAQTHSRRQTWKRHISFCSLTALNPVLGHKRPQPTCNERGDGVARRCAAPRPRARRRGPGVGGQAQPVALLVLLLHFIPEPVQLRVQFADAFSVGGLCTPHAVACTDAQPQGWASGKNGGYRRRHGGRGQDQAIAYGPRGRARRGRVYLGAWAAAAQSRETARCHTSVVCHRILLRPLLSGNSRQTSARAHTHTRGTSPHVCVVVITEHKRWWRHLGVPPLANDSGLGQWCVSTITRACASPPFTTIPCFLMRQQPHERGSDAKKQVCVPQIGLQFRASSLNFIFPQGRFF